MHNSLNFVEASTRSYPEYILAATCKIIPSHMQTEIKNRLIDKIGKLIEAKEISKLENMLEKNRNHSNMSQLHLHNEKIAEYEAKIKKTINDLKDHLEIIASDKSFAPLTFITPYCRETNDKEAKTVERNCFEEWDENPHYILEQMGNHSSYFEEEIEEKIKNVEIKIEENAINIINKAAGVITKIKNKNKYKKDLLDIPEETENKIVFYTAHHLRFLPGTKIFDNRKNAFHEIYDFDARQGYRNSVNVFKFWSDIFGIKEKYRIKATIHYKKNYNNAHFHPTSNKNHLIFGDGNKHFGKFVRSLAIVAHEMFHAITKNRLNYYGESGALNEHYSDIVGACCDMYINNISVEDYHWEFAPNILRHKKGTYPMRSFKAPGTAYNLPFLGKDPQPDDYKNVDPNYRKDHGGVHIYSGIPNHVFYLVCLACNDWKEPIIFWKKILDKLDDPNITFSEFADLQIQNAIYEGNENLATALREAWNAMNVPLSA